jgi:hypothetical protein
MMQVDLKTNNDNDVIQTLRTAHQNQTQLNLMADQKANILIGTLVLMFTVVISRLMTLVDDTDKNLVPIIVFLILELVPLVLTTLVLIPKNIATSKKLKIDQMPNPLFFGFFTRYSESEYLNFINSKLINNDSARQMLIIDIYEIGVILRKKYALLRYAYIFAMIGVILPIIIWLFMLLIR